MSKSEFLKVLEKASDREMKYLPACFTNGIFYAKNKVRKAFLKRLLLSFGSEKK